MRKICFPILLFYCFISESKGQIAVHYETKTFEENEWRWVSDENYNLFISGQSSMFSSDPPTEFRPARNERDPRIFQIESMHYVEIARVDYKRTHLRLPSDAIHWTDMDLTDTICGFSCKVAFYKRGTDSVFAWYSPELPKGFGPFRTTGLPGTILQVLDGQVCHYATSVSDSLMKIELPFYNSLSEEELAASVDKARKKGNNFSRIQVPSNSNTVQRAVIPQSEVFKQQVRTRGAVYNP